MPAEVLGASEVNDPFLYVDCYPVLKIWDACTVLLENVGLYQVYQQMAFKSLRGHH